VQIGEKDQLKETLATASGFAEANVHADALMHVAR